MRVEDGVAAADLRDARWRALVPSTRRRVADGNGPGNLAVRKYLNDLHIPQVFVLAPTERYNDPQHFPWTIGLQPTYYLDGEVHAR